MTTNYRGKEITWVRLFRVLNDYLDGKREYSYNAKEDLCSYRLDGKPECSTACLIGSFLSNDKYRFETNDSVVGGIVGRLTKAPDVDIRTLINMQRIHDSLAKGDFSASLTVAKCLTPPQRHVKKKTEIIEKISKRHS